MELNPDQLEVLRAHFLLKRRENERSHPVVYAPRKFNSYKSEKEDFVAEKFANLKISPRHDKAIEKLREQWPKIVRGLAKHTWPKHIDHFRLAVEVVHPVYKKLLYRMRHKVVAILHDIGFKSLEDIWIEERPGAAHIHQRALAEIQTKWSEIAYPLDKHSLPEEIKGRKLVVLIDHPSFAQNLQLQQPQILRHIHDLGYVHIEAIIRKIGTIDWSIIHAMKQAEQNNAPAGQKNEADDSDIPISAGALEMLEGLRDLKKKE